MKKLWCLVTALLLLALAGCGEKTPSAAASSEALPTQPLHLEHLTLELQRSAGSGAELMRAVKELPALVQRALGGGGVTVEEVTVTVSSGAAATAQAVLDGSVDAAVLSACELAALEEEPCVMLAAGAGDGGMPGRRMLLCAADTEYGRNLASRKAPTWTELDRARWGVVAGDLWGHDAVELWLADNYGGNGLEDLSGVTAYDDWEELFSAVGRGEVDVFPATADLPGTAEYAVLGETERFYTTVVIVKEELADGRFSAALLSALQELQQGEFASLFGTEPYGGAEEDALMAHRRMAALMG